MTVVRTYVFKVTYNIYASFRAVGAYLSLDCIFQFISV